MKMETDATSILLTFLKKKHLVIGGVDELRSSVVSGTVQLEKSTDLHIRDSLIGKSMIMMEDLENHCYIVSVKTGFLNNVLAYAIIKRNCSVAEIVVYAREGMIKQRLAEKALEKIQIILS